MDGQVKGQGPNSITQTTNQKLMLTQNTIVTVDTISLHTLRFLVAHKITTVVSTHTHTHTHTQKKTTTTHYNSKNIKVVQRVDLIRLKR